jgi:hypothetical protein
MHLMERFFSPNNLQDHSRDAHEASNPDTPDRLAQITHAVGILAGFLLAAVVVWAFCFAWITVHDLFAIHLRATPTLATLAAGSSVGLLAVMGLVNFGIRHNRMRALATLYAGGWFALVVCLVAVKLVFDATVTDAESVKVVARSILNSVPWLTSAGNLIAAVLAGICLAPTLSMLGAMKHPREDMTEDEAKARYSWNAGKLIISGASIGLAILFGADVLGINVFVAVLLGLVLDVGFLVALQKAESSAHAGDHRHAATWTRFLWVYGLAIALMAVETIPALAARMGTPINVPLVTDNATLHSLGRLAYIAAIGMGILTIVLVATSTIRQQREEDLPTSRMTIRPPRPIAHRLAEGIRSLRAGAGEIGDALRGKPAQLQAPARVVLQSEGATLGALTSSTAPSQTESRQTEPRQTSAAQNERSAEGESWSKGDDMAGQGAPAPSKRN